MKLYLAFIAAMLLIGSSTAATISVCPSGCNYSIIQQAIDSSHSGDTISVGSGTYYENVYVSKDVTLRGVDTGKGRPVINAGGSGSAVILYADNITLDGFNLTGSGSCGCGNAGIKIMANNCTVFNNIVDKNKYGIYCGNNQGNKIYLNKLVGNNITAFDGGKNEWYENTQTLGDAAKLVPGLKEVGNYYSDLDKLGKGCNDTNKDGICDTPYDILGGKNVDKYPLTSGDIVS